jgi:signal transduction histidine kinase
MRNLAEFIKASSTEIVEFSVRFAGTLGPLANERVEPEILRDHLPLILKAIAADLDCSQTRTASIAKAEGHGPAEPSESAAQIHGRLRAQSGLTVDQVVSEYRVLRATVTRLWTDAVGEADRAALNDLVRFNEAIDQAIAESVAYHSAEVERWRAMLLAIVGHDLREPLNTVVMMGEVIAKMIGDSPLASQAVLLQRGSNRLRALLDSLLEYSNAKLGARMPIDAQQTDLELACRGEIELLRSAFPTVDIEIKARGSLQGRFDASRVRQALNNLVSNAVQYRTPNSPIEVLLDGRSDSVTVAVVNDGEPIDQRTLDTLFEPLRRREGERGGQRRNFGLGLFIVREIAAAHGGAAFAESRDDMLHFGIKLPRVLDQASAGPTQPERAGAR